MVLQSVGSSVSRGHHFNIEPFKEGTGPKLGQLELGFNLVIDRRGRFPVQFRFNSKDAREFIRHPGPCRRAPEEIEVFRKDLPGLAVVPLGLAAVPSRNPQAFQRNPLGLEHPEHIMIGNDEKVRGRTERGIFI